jgi:hypothetical protein
LEKREPHNTVKMSCFFEKERTAQHHQDGFFLWKRENFTTLSRQVLSLEKRELPALSKLFFDCLRTTNEGTIDSNLTTQFFLWKKRR